MLGDLQHLPDAAALAIFTIEDCLCGRVKIAGPDYHSSITDRLASGGCDANELSRFLRQLYPAADCSRKRFDRAARRAERRLAEGYWIAARQVEDRFPQDCPGVLFGRGKLDPDARWLAIHNSRKTRLPSPSAEWPAALRRVLAAKMPGAATGIASSCGTTTYDMLTVFAREKALPLCLVVPFPLQGRSADETLAALLPAGDRPELVISCQSAVLRCPGGVRLFCRDRLLAHLAAVNLALEIRSGGNLHHILQERQRSRPGSLMVFQPAVPHPRNSGNVALRETFPDIQTFKLQAPPAIPSSVASAATPQLSGRSLPTERYWNRYLYHYTRACPGPWPGQPYRDYLLALLVDEPLCGHSALETLVRMLRERRVRASNRITRGPQPVISWSAEPPSAMAAMRRWNRALMRWTVEPYGIAISKTVLRTLGAKPAIYGQDKVFSRLRAGDRFRYQRHEPPACVWKHEREWRLPGDLPLDECCRRHGFIFVDTDADAAYVAQHAEIEMPLLILSALRRPPQTPP